MNKKLIMAIIFTLVISAMSTSPYTYAQEISTYLETGKTAVNQSKYSIAKDNYIQALNIDPSNIEANFYMGFIYGEEGNFKQAQKYLKKASDLEPNNPITHGMLGAAYAETKDYQLALDELEKVKSINPEMGVKLNTLIDDIKKEMDKNNSSK
jgi:tetratricopeptide (TPR) repeat protein